MLANTFENFCSVAACNTQWTLEYPQTIQTVYVGKTQIQCVFSVDEHCPTSDMNLDAFEHESRHEFISNAPLRMQLASQNDQNEINIIIRILIRPAIGVRIWIVRDQNACVLQGFTQQPKKALTCRIRHSEEELHRL